MAGLRGAFSAAVITGGVLLGAVACGGSSTVTAPTNPVGGGADSAASSGPTSLPATAPGSSATAPSGYPGGSSPVAAPGQSGKDKEFIGKVRGQGIKAPDDVVINAAQFACEYDKSGRDAKNLEPFVVGILGPYDGNNAKANATKFIAEARASYCKA